MATSNKESSLASRIAISALISSKVSTLIQQARERHKRQAMGLQDHMVIQLLEEVSIKGLAQSGAARLYDDRQP